MVVDASANVFRGDLFSTALHELSFLFVAAAAQGDRNSQCHVPHDFLEQDEQQCNKHDEDDPPDDRTQAWENRDRPEDALAKVVGKALRAVLTKHPPVEGEQYADRKVCGDQFLFSCQLNLHDLIVVLWFAGGYSMPAPCG